MKTPGQAAYEKWTELTATERQWEHVHPAWRKRWEQVANAAIDNHIARHDPLGAAND